MDNNNNNKNNSSQRCYFAQFALICVSFAYSHTHICIFASFSEAVNDMEIPLSWLLIKFTYL